MDDIEQAEPEIQQGLDVQANQAEIEPSSVEKWTQVTGESVGKRPVTTPREVIDTTNGYQSLEDSTINQKIQVVLARGGCSVIQMCAPNTKPY